MTAPAGRPLPAPAEAGAVRGWCPGAWRPMLAGDGLIVRVRPVAGRLTRAQLAGLAALAHRFGSGLLDLTRRANLQIRGIAEADHPALLSGLADLGLLDPDPAAEARRNLIVEPFWQPGCPTDRLAQALLAALPDLPDLPAKVGFAVDAGPVPHLRDAPADIRIERCAAGLIVRADGAATGRAVAEAAAVEAVIDLARWFAAARGDERRMAPLLVREPLPARFGGTAPAPAAPRPDPGPTPLGALAGIAFGRIAAEALARAATGAAAIRLTPWRMVLFEGRATCPAGLIATAADPLLGADACPGAPACAAATVETRDLARHLAGRVAGSLHVSGCAKGCARSSAADVTLVGRNGRFDLVRDGRAGDTPVRRGLTPADLSDLIG